MLERGPVVMSSPGDSSARVEAVLDDIETALASAERADDDREVARLLAVGAHAALRRGDVPRARGFADRAARGGFRHRTAQFDAIRAQGFAASAAGDLESALHQTIKARAMARDLGRVGEQAEQSCTLAAIYLALGAPAEARSCAEAALHAATALAMHDVAALAEVCRAAAAAELGDLDGAIAQLDQIALDRLAVAPRVDVACVHAFWLLERGAAGDSRRAEALAIGALAVAERTGDLHRRTAIYASLARAAGRRGDDVAARAQLEKARRASDRAEPAALSLLALATAEVLPADDPHRQVVALSARSRILRTAARREDPRGFCASVRLHRHLLELTGGVPTDLPGPS